MKKVLLIILVMMFVFGCRGTMPGQYHEGRNKTFVTKTHAYAYALRMSLKGYDTEVKTYQQWWNHGTYWYGVYVTEKDEKTK